MIRPEDFADILGTTFVRTSAAPVFQLKRGPSFDRFQLAAIGIPQIKAARWLHRLCRRLSIDTFPQLADRLDELPAIRGTGHAAFYVARALLKHHGLDARAQATYADAAVSKRHQTNPANRSFEPVPVKLATLKRRRPLHKLKRRRAA